MMRSLAIAAAVSVAFWALISFVLYYAVMSFAIPSNLALLDERGHRAVGRVIGRDAADHARIDYEFTSNGVRYTGSGRPGGVNARFEDLTPGTSVYITYDPTEPATSMLGYPEQEVSSSRRLIGLGSIVASTFLGVTIFGVVMAFMKILQARP